jgi:arylsulfatase A-like enzyme
MKIFLTALAAFLFYDKLVAATDEQAFDIIIDPTESEDVVADDDYQGKLQIIRSTLDGWADLLADEDSSGTKYFSDNSTKTLFAEMGGIYPYTEVDYTPTTIDVKYTSLVSTGSPHIIFVLVDDWGYNDVSYHTNYMLFTTPNIEKLATDGVIIEHYYSESSCAPARSALMTGRYPLRTGMQKKDESAELPLDEITLAQELKSANYKTYMVGKWHLGMSSTQRTPLARGFDYHYGYYSGYIDYYTKINGDGYVDWQNNGTVETDPDAYLTDDDHHSAYLLQQKVEDVIDMYAEEETDQPMFLYYSLQLVHFPNEAPSRFYERCDSSSDSDEVQYCGKSLMLDEVIGNLTCKLQNTGIYDNAIIIVAGDNGGYSGIDGTSYPFRGYKFDMSEGGIRTNAFLHSPLFDESFKGTTYDGMFHVTDWLPTIMNWATNNEWTGSYSNATIDGVDQDDALWGTSSYPRFDLVVFISVNATDFTVISDGVKLTTEGISSELVGVPKMTFSTDLDPDSSLIESCDLGDFSISKSYYYSFSESLESPLIASLAATISNVVFANGLLGFVILSISFVFFYIISRIVKSNNKPSGLLHLSSKTIGNNVYTYDQIPSDVDDA